MAYDTCRTHAGVGVPSIPRGVLHGVALVIPAWVKLATMAVLMAGSYYMGYSRASTSEQLDEATRANNLWVERSVLAGKLAESDRKLAESQALIMQGVGVQVIKREVIYRDKIKDPAVRDCVADSGLLELYDASLGLDKPAE